MAIMDDNTDVIAFALISYQINDYYFAILFHK